MRTTLTLDPDVAAALTKRRALRGTRLKDEVNDLLRAGLNASPTTARATELPEPPLHSLGAMLVTDYRELQDLLDEEDIDRALGRDR